MKPNFPVYEFLITDDENDESGVSTISLVSMPAMKTDFIKFSQQTVQKYVFISRDDKQYKGIVAGIAMKPMELVERIDEDNKQKFYGYFSAETIEKIRTKFHKNPENLRNVNIEHNGSKPVNAYLVESYILDSQEMVDAVKAKGISDATLGSWYTAFKIEDKEVFNKCLKGEFNGFSVEAFLMRELRNIETKNNFSDIKIKKMKKNLIERIGEKFNQILKEMSFSESLVPDMNIVITWGSKDDKVTKTYKNAEGVDVTEPTGAGEFVIEDGRTVVVGDDSSLIEVREAKPEKTDEEKAVEKPEEKMKEEKMKEEVPAEEKPVEEMPEVSGDTKQKKTKEEICAECPDCPECLEAMASEEKPKEEEEEVKEEMPEVSGETKEEKVEIEVIPVADEEMPKEEEDVEDMNAPEGNTNACKHGGRSTTASGYCNGIAKPKEDKPEAKKPKAEKKAEEKPKEEAPKAEGKSPIAEIKEDIKKEAPVEKKDTAPLREGEPESPKPKKLLTSQETGELRGKLNGLDKVKDKAEYDAIAKKLIENDLNYFENQVEFEDYMIKRFSWWDNYDGNPNKGKPELIAGAADSMKKTIEFKKKKYEDEAKKLKGILNSGDYSNYGFITEEFSIQKFNEIYGFELLQEDFSALKAENESLKAEVAALKVKLSEPIGEPILRDKPELKPEEYKEISVYERVARRKGLPIV
jgi:hypothetical protein